MSGGNLFKLTIDSTSILVLSPVGINLPDIRVQRVKKKKKIGSNDLPQNKIIFHNDVENDEIMNSLWKTKPMSLRGRDNNQQNLSKEQTKLGLIVCCLVSVSDTTILPIF